MLPSGVPSLSPEPCATTRRGTDGTARPVLKQTRRSGRPPCVSLVRLTDRGLLHGAGGSCGWGASRDVLTASLRCHPLSPLSRGAATAEAALSGGPSAWPWSEPASRRVKNNNQPPPGLPPQGAD